MADAKVSALSAITTLNTTDLFYVVDDGSTSKKITWENLASQVVADNIVGKNSLWIPATAMTPRTTNGPAYSVTETSTNKIMRALLNFDASTAEYAQFIIGMPTSWDEGTVTAIVYWSHGTATTNFGVTWGLQAVAVSNDDTMEAAFGTAVTVDDTGGTAEDIYISDETAACTIAGTPAAGDLVIFQVYRNPAAAGDTLAVDARIHGIKLNITTNAANDA